MLSRHGVGPPIVGEQPQRFARELQRVVDSVAAIRAQRQGRRSSARQADPSAIRCPARFPLSTDEMYFGSSGRRSCVSYQL